MRSAVVLAAVLAVTASSSPAFAQADPATIDTSAIDAYIDEQMAAAGIPGLGVAVVVGDQTAYVRGYGEADADGRTVSAQTPFIIGSVTKSMTGVAVMQLVETGQVDLDASVAEYLPWFETADPEATPEITVRHLLYHTSGFSTYDGRTTLVASDLSDDAIETAVRDLNDVSLTHPAGEHYAYSNHNYDVLGALIQTVSRQPYESYVQEHIFEPLNMTHSYTSQRAAEEDDLARGHLSWFGVRFAKTFGYNRGHLPSGYIIASAEDMGHFLVAQLNEGRFADTVLLSPEAMEATHQPGAATETTDVFYGMGWLVDNTTDEPIIWHAGSNSNYSSYVRMLPQQELAVAVLTNINGFAALADAAGQIATGVTALVRGQQPEPYETPGILRLVIGSVVVPAAVAVAWVAVSAIRFARRRPHRSLRAVAVPLIVDVAILWALLFGIPMMWQLPLPPLFRSYPDMATLIVAGAGTVIVWAIVRTVLLARRPEKTAHPPTPQRTPMESPAT